MKKRKNIKDFQTRVPYDAEERYSFFVERKIVVPQPHQNKKKYKRSRDKRVIY